MGEDGGRFYGRVERGRAVAWTRPTNGLQRLLGGRARHHASAPSATDRTFRSIFRDVDATTAIRHFPPTNARMLDSVTTVADSNIGRRIVTSE